jgi:hypothetical protein
MKPYQIFVKGLTSTNLILDVEENDNIQFIKCHLNDKTGIEPKSIQLYFKDQLLNDDETLKEKEIGVEDILEARICKKIA